MGAAGKGKPKDFSKAERKRRSERMKALNAKRRAESQNDLAHGTAESEQHQGHSKGQSCRLWMGLPVTQAPKAFGHAKNDLYRFS